MTAFLRPRVSALGLLHSVGALAALGTVSGFLADWGWWLELTCHFRLQYALALLAVGLLTTLRPRRSPSRGSLRPLPCGPPSLVPARTPLPTAAPRVDDGSPRVDDCVSGLPGRGDREVPSVPKPRDWRPGSLYAALAIVNLVVLAPYLVPGQPRVDSPGQRLRVVTLNVHTANPRHDLVEAYLRREDPDVVVLTEVDARWLAQLTPLTNRWPHAVQAPRDDNFGIALFSRHALGTAGVVYVGEAGVPSIEAEVMVAGRRVVVFGTHPLPPGSAEHTAWRDEQLDRVAERLAAQADPRVLLGDLNTTPWAPAFRRLVARSGLIDSLRGRGYQPTWPGSFVPFWIPLDHCLVSPDVIVLDRRVGPHVGSDHRPVSLDLGLPRPSSGERRSRGSVAATSPTAGWRRLPGPETTTDQDLAATLDTRGGGR